MACNISVRQNLQVYSIQPIQNDLSDLSFIINLMLLCDHAKTACPVPFDFNLHVVLESLSSSRLESFSGLIVPSLTHSRLLQSLRFNFAPLLSHSIYCVFKIVFVVYIFFLNM